MNTFSIAGILDECYKVLLADGCLQYDVEKTSAICNGFLDFFLIQNNR